MTSLLRIICYLFVYQFSLLLYLLVVRVMCIEIGGSVCVLHLVCFLVCFVRGLVSRWFCTVFANVCIIQNSGI